MRVAGMQSDPSKGSCARPQRRARGGGGGPHLTSAKVRVQKGALRLHGGLALELKVSRHAQPILGQATEALRQVPTAASWP